MKYLMIMVLFCTSINIAACDKKNQERKQWQRQYMPLVQLGENYRSQSIMMFALSLLCGPAVMIQPVMHPMDLMKLPTIEAEDLKNILAVIAYHSSDVKIESRLLTLQDIGIIENVRPVQKKLKPHQLKKQDILKEQFTHCKIAKNPSQK